MAEWPITHRGVVYPWECDQVGHMNVTWYVAKFDQATWSLFALVGITPSYVRGNRRGMAAVEQNLAYKCELRAGDVVTVRSGVLEVRDKVLRYLHEMVNEETGDLAATCTLTSVHLDMDARKSCPFPPEILQRAREMMAASEAGLR